MLMHNCRKTYALCLGAMLYSPVHGVSAQQVLLSDSTFWLATAQAVTRATLARECIHVAGASRFIIEPSHARCQVVRLVPLGRTADTAWSYTLYRHTEIYQFADRVTPDTIVELELVLLASRRGSSDSLSAVAHVREDFNAVADMSFEMATHPAGVLLTGAYCLNGTGGCWQEFLLHRRGRWRSLPDPYPLIQSSLREQGLLDVGTERLKVPTIEVRTLRGTSALYGPSDPNCCPAREAQFQLALEARGFKVVSVRVVNQPARR